MLITERTSQSKVFKKMQEEMHKMLVVSDYYRGANYYKGYINYINTKLDGDILINTFKIESERTSTKYQVNYKMTKKGNIISGECNCPQYKNYGSCKHVAAAIYNSYINIYDKYKPKETKISITNELFDYFKTEKNSNIKKEIKVETHIDASYYYGVFKYEMYLKIGLTRLYMCKSKKLLNLLKAYNKYEELEIGKSYSYNPKEQYFNNQDKKLIDYLLSIINGEYGVNTNGNNVKEIIKLSNIENLYINNKKIKEIRNIFPLQADLKKEEGNYTVNFIDREELDVITLDYEYILKGGVLYHLSNDEKKLMKILYLNDLDSLCFEEKSFKNFKNSILPIVRSNIKIDSTLEKVIISTKPKAKLYFDIYEDMITCNIKLDYAGREINYFDDNDTIIRDEKYENEIISDLQTNHFSIENNKIYLETLDNVVDFLEEGIGNISKKYDTYTSEKLKQTNIVKKTNVKATFSIGKDNILSYQFDLGSINKSEINELLQSLKNNKRYYKLKSGDIIDLNDKNLNELNELSEDLGLKAKDITKKKGEIPKYRAIYLDSLKKDKYGIIKTNNLFDELIEKFNKYKNQNITFSKEDKETLRGYQTDGVKWLTNIATTGFGGILADEMGLGKSIQTICFMKQLLKKNKDSKFLIIVPTSLAYNWESEFQKFGNKMKYKVLAGTKAKRIEEEKDISNTNILITTYGLLREDIEFYKSINFEVMVIDEAQNIKNSNTKITKAVKSIKANTKIALTGTPIENSVAELWSIFDYMMPGYLGSIQNFQQKYRIQNFDEDADKRIKLLTRQIEPFIMRRKKKDVVKDLPDKIENNIFIELDENQKKLYLAELEKVKQATEIAMKEGGMKKVAFMILSLLTTLRQICIHPKIVFNDYKGKSSKIEQFVEVVKNSVENGHKILVFSNFRNALEIARSSLTKENISSYVLDGSVNGKKRMQLVDKFNEDETNVFFIMLKAGGTGLNLTGADVVIHLDLWWNPQAENQATDRAHRIGQKNTVEVVKIICKGTIEEKILELQQKKKILSDKLIDSNNKQNTFSKLTEEDIKHLLSYENKE